MERKLAVTKKKNVHLQLRCLTIKIFFENKAVHSVRRRGSEAAGVGRADEAGALDLFISHIQRRKERGKKRQSEREAVEPGNWQSRRLQPRDGERSAPR